MKIALAALVALSACTPAVAGEYQAGYSSTRTCYRTEYREEDLSFVKCPAESRSGGAGGSFDDNLEPSY